MTQITVTKKCSFTAKLFKNFKSKTQKGVTALLTSFFKSKSFALFGVSSGFTVVQGEQRVLFSPLSTQRELPLGIEKHDYGVFKKNLIKKNPALSILKISNAIATKSGANLTLDGKFIRQLFEPLDDKTIHDHPLFHFSAKRISPSIRVSAEPVVTLAFHKQDNLYHWLFDTLPRLYLLENAHLPVKRLYIDCAQSFQRESLDLLGIGPDRVIDASQVDALSASELIIPSMPGLTGHPPKWVCDYLRSNFLPHLETPLAPAVLQRKKQLNCYGAERGERVFLTDSSHKIPLTSSLLNLLEKYQFNIVDICNLDFIEQIRLFSLTSIMISYHQTALSYLVFAESNMKVLELFTTTEVNPCHWTITNEVGVHYHYLASANQDPDRLEKAIISLLNASAD